MICRKEGLEVWKVAMQPCECAGVCVKEDPEVTVKKSDLEKWVKAIKEANAFKQMVAEDAMFIESTMVALMQAFGVDNMEGINKLADNPLSAIAKIGRIINNPDKLGIDITRFKEIAEKYRVKPAQQIEGTKTEETNG